MRQGATMKIERIARIPLSKAFKISMQSIRIRFWRSMITAGGVFLGIAFLASVLITTPLADTVERERQVRLGLMKKVYTIADMNGHKVVLDGTKVLVDDKPTAVDKGAFKLDGKEMLVKDLRDSGKMSYVLTDLAKATRKDLKEEQEERNAKARQTWLVVMSLLVCSVGIANAMLMSVTERFREIGTMKCLGALDKFIVQLFLFEALFLGIIASIVGWLVGFTVMSLAYWARGGWVTIANLELGQLGMTLLYCLVIGTSLTVVSAIFPALRAASLPAAAALRTEI